MLNRKTLLIGMLTLGLTACEISSGGVDFPFTNEPELPTFFRNGDNYGVEDVELSYHDLVRDVDADFVLEKLGNNEPVFLFLHGDHCNPCKSIKTRYNQFLLDSDIEAYCLPQRDMLDQINRIRDAYPGMKGTIIAQTPSAYLLLPDGTAIDTEVAENIAVASNYENHVKPLINLSLVYTFTKEDSLSKFLSDSKSLVYFAESEPSKSGFRSKLLQDYQAASIGKPLAYVDLASIGEDSRSYITESFGDNLDGRVFYVEKGEVHETNQLLEEACLEGGLVNQYYTKVRI